MQMKWKNFIYLFFSWIFLKVVNNATNYFVSNEKFVFSGGSAASNQQGKTRVGKAPLF